MENIKYLGEEKISSIIGVFILNGSNETISKLKQLLKNPVFKEYHICRVCGLKFWKELANSQILQAKLMTRS